MRKGKDPDPYLWLMNPDLDPQHCFVPNLVLEKNLLFSSCCTVPSEHLFSNFYLLSPFFSLLNLFILLLGTGTVPLYQYLIPLII